MFLLWWTLAGAQAETCPDVSRLTVDAWAAFNDAELERAKETLAKANASLACQTRVVTRDELLRLFRLDALVSISLEDRKSAVYATIRAVTVDPTATPGEELGPELQEMHASWLRLADTKHAIDLEGTGKAWVDGTQVPEAGVLRVVAGEHLVQLQDAAGIRSEVREVSADLLLRVGEVVAAVDPPKGDPPKGDPPKVADPVEPVKLPTDPPKTPRKHRGGLVVASLVTAAAGGGAVAWGYLQEAEFLARPYTPTAIGDCEQGEACYPDMRERLIRRDAQRVRLAYGSGYALMGAGAVLLGTELFILPEPTGGEIGVRFRW